MRFGLAPTLYLKGFMSINRKFSKGSKVLPNLRVTLSLNEEEILNCLDLICSEESKENPIINKEQINKLKNIFFESHHNIWQTKEIKTRKYGFMDYQSLFLEKGNQRIMEEIRVETSNEGEYE